MLLYGFIWEAVVNDPIVNTFLAGMVTAGFLAAGLFFARFWARSRDVLFLAFTAAFWLLALNEALVALVPEPAWRAKLVLSAARGRLPADRRRHRPQEHQRTGRGLASTVSTVIWPVETSATHRL